MHPRNKCIIMHLQILIINATASGLYIAASVGRLCCTWMMTVRAKSACLFELCIRPRHAHSYIHIYTYICLQVEVRRFSCFINHIHNTTSVQVSVHYMNNMVMIKHTLSRWKTRVVRCASLVDQFRLAFARNISRGANFEFMANHLWCYYWCNKCLIWLDLNWEDFAAGKREGSWVVECGGAALEIWFNDEGVQRSIKPFYAKTVRQQVFQQGCLIYFACIEICEPGCKCDMN